MYLSYMWGSRDLNSGPRVCLPSTFAHWAISPALRRGFGERQHGFPSNLELGLCS